MLKWKPLYWQLTAYLDLEGSSSGLLPFLASVRNLSKPKGSSSSFSNWTGPSRRWARSVPANSLSGWNLGTEEWWLHNTKRSRRQKSSKLLLCSYAILLSESVKWLSNYRPLWKSLRKSSLWLLVYNDKSLLLRLEKLTCLFARVFPSHHRTRLGRHFYWAGR